MKIAKNNCARNHNSLVVFFLFFFGISFVLPGEVFCQAESEIDKEFDEVEDLLTRVIKQALDSRSSLLQLKRENEELMKRIDELARVKTESAEVNEKIQSVVTDLRQENELFRQYIIEELEKIETTTPAQIKEVEQRNRDLERNLDNLNRLLSSTKSEKAESENIIIALRKKNELLKQKVDKLEQELSSSDMKKLLEDLKAQNTESENAIFELRHKNAELIRQIEELRAAGILSADTDTAELNNIIENLQRENELLKLQAKKVAMELRSCADRSGSGRVSTTQVLEPGVSAKKMRHFCLGYIYAQDGKYEQALKEFNQVLKYDPDDIDSYFNLGCIYARRKDFSKAIEKFKKVLSLNPEDVEASYNLSVIYSENLQDEKTGREYYLRSLPDVSE